MQRFFRLLVAAVVVAALPLSSAGAAPDKTGTVTPSTPFTWDGTVATGTAFQNFIGGTGPVPPLECSKDVTSYCEFVLVAVDLSLTEEEIKAGNTRKTGSATVSIGEPTVAAYDFDLKIYDSDAQGNKFDQVASVGDLDETPGEESYTLTASGNLANPIDYYLVEVIYFYSVQGNYKGRVALTNVRARP